MSLCAADLMTSEIKAVEPEMRLSDLEAFFTNERMSGAPVVSAGRLIGVVSRSDVVRVLAREDKQIRTEISFYYYLSPWDEEVTLPDLVTHQSSTLLGRRLETLKVKDAMTHRIVAVAPDASIEDLCKEMTAHRVHRVLVIEGEALRGLVSSLDVVRAVAERGLSR
jgi:CBS domain-containing protein